MLRKFLSPSDGEENHLSRASPPVFFGHRVSNTSKSKSTPAPSKSKDSELVWSKADGIVTKRRNRLDPQRVAKLVFLKHNQSALKKLDL